jgi:hypothetical protein
MESVDAGHINVDGAEHTIDHREKIAIGFKHQTAIVQDVCNPKLRCNAAIF